MSEPISETFSIVSSTYVLAEHLLHVESEPARQASQPLDIPSPPEYLEHVLGRVFVRTDCPVFSLRSFFGAAEKAALDIRVSLHEQLLMEISFFERKLIELAINLTLNTKSLRKGSDSAAGQIQVTTDTKSLREGSDSGVTEI
jgi:hypothetical protein